MPAMDRLLTEQLFHDRQASDRQALLAEHPARLNFDDESYLEHETWIKHAVERLGNVQDLQVLDCGCGHGMASVLLARRGALVTAIDLSEGYLNEAAPRAAVAGIEDRIRLVQGSAEQLPFADSTFDRIWGNAILHHLDITRASSEVRRVVKPNGVAVFCEPWGGNPLLEWARRRLPYPGKDRSPDERPLRESDIAILRRYFRRVDVEQFQLLGMARRLWRSSPPSLGWLNRIDSALFRCWPGLQKFSRYVVLTLYR